MNRKRLVYPSNIFLCGCMRVKSLQSCLTLCDPFDYSRPQTPPSMGFSRQECWSGLLCPPPGDLPNSGIDPRSPALQVYSLPSEPSGKPKNTEMGRLYLLQRIFPTQESNQGLLHYRQILYQLRYQRRPNKIIFLSKSRRG